MRNPMHPNSNPSLLLVPVCASTFGFVSGLLTGSQRASLQFLAENAHRQPNTLQGWYFYNKTKNYRVALAGFRGGLRTAARLGGWTSAFVAVQELASSGLRVGEAQGGAASGTLLAFAASAVCRQRSGFLKKGESALTFGSADRLPRKTLPKRLLLGASLGALAGGLQDAKTWLQQARLQEAATAS